MSRHLWLMALAAVLGYAATPAFAQISDDFESDTSADYTLVSDTNGASGDGAFDGTSAFAFDYIAAGIPLAPNSAPGDRGGLRFTVNDTEEGDEGATSTEEDHITAFHNTAMSGKYRLDVDMYMGVNLGASGTTEFAHVGVAGSSNDFLSIFTPIVDNGHFISITGEGGSSSDYRHSAPGSPAIPSGDLSYLNVLHSTNAAIPEYQAIYPATDVPGSPTNVWTTLTITVADKVTYWLDGTAIIQIDTVSDAGLVGLGYTDPFDSVGPHFIIYDNLSVTAIPEPTAALLALAGLAGSMVRRRG